MNEPDPIEHVIHDLPWRRPSGAMDRRVERATTGRRFGVASLAAAAALGAAVGGGVVWAAAETAHDAGPGHIAARPTPPAADATRAAPGAATGSTIERIEIEPAQPVALFVDEAGNPLQVLRQPIVRTTTWYDEAAGTSIEVSEPASYLIIADPDTL